MRQTAPILRFVAPALLAAGVSAAPPCLAEEGASDDAVFVQPQRGAFTASAGWPGLTVGYLSGRSPHFDVGGHLDLNYVFEGGVTSFFPGGRLTLDLLWSLPFASFASLVGGVSAGAVAYFPSGEPILGLTVPVEVDAVLRVAEAWWIVLTGVATLAFYPLTPGLIEAQAPIEGGLGARFRASDRVVLFWAARGGAYFGWVTPHGAFSTFVFDVRVGVRYTLL